jgi:hypothetical protein
MSLLILFLLGIVACPLWFLVSVVDIHHRTLIELGDEDGPV